MTREILSDIHEERARQVNLEGYDAKHDDGHDRGELAIQAAELCVDGTDARLDKELVSMPCWGVTEKHRGDRRRQLIIAAALIVAEIERIERAERAK